MLARGGVTIEVVQCRIPFLIFCTVWNIFVINLKLIIHIFEWFSSISRVYMVVFRAHVCRFDSTGSRGRSTSARKVIAGLQLGAS